jgi:hypothetical protein
MSLSRNPFLTCVASVYYLLAITPLLLVSCDNELNVDKRQTEFEEHDEVRDVGNNAHTQFSSNDDINEVIPLNSPNNNVEDKTEAKKRGEKFIYNNVSYLPIKENKTEEEKNESDADYDYDYDESHNIFNWSELIPTLVVYGATMVIGIAGNSLIIFTICRYRRMKSTTNVFLASLASADLLLIIICIPVKVGSRTCLFPSDVMIVNYV